MTFGLNVTLDGILRLGFQLARPLPHRMRRILVARHYVVSASRRDFPWNNTFRIEGDLHEAVTQLKEKTPRGVLVGSPTLSAALQRLG